MEDEIYIASQAANQLKSLPASSRDRAAKLIDSLRGDGWQNSQIVLPDDDSPNQGLRSKILEDIRVFFRHSPEQHAIVVADVSSIYAREFAATA